VVAEPGGSSTARTGGSRWGTKAWQAASAAGRARRPSSRILTGWGGGATARPGATRSPPPVPGGAPTGAARRAAAWRGRATGRGESAVAGLAKRLAAAAAGERSLDDGLGRPVTLLGVGAQDGVGLDLVHLVGDALGHGGPIVRIRVGCGKPKAPADGRGRSQW